MDVYISKSDCKTTSQNSKRTRILIKPENKIRPNIEQGIQLSMETLHSLNILIKFLPLSGRESFGLQWRSKHRHEWTESCYILSYPDISVFVRFRSRMKTGSRCLLLSEDLSQAESIQCSSQNFSVIHILFIGSKLPEE